MHAQFRNRVAARSRALRVGLMAAASVLGSSSLALADDARSSALDLSLGYTADVTGVVDGGISRRGRFLDNLELGLDLDLEKAFGWRGGVAHVLLLNNSGGMPNDDAGTAQGVDNIEVSRQRARLFEAWAQQSFAGDSASVLVGLYDLNSEFYANDSAGLLIGPAFGIGSELAATGPNGPSIFPSTALAVRLKWAPREDLYLQAAVLNAEAGVLGDPDGIDTSFHDGALLVAEAGWTGSGKLAVGAWRYSQKQDDIRDLAPSGGPAHRNAQGAYLLAEHPLDARVEGPRRATAFARLGLSDGDTTDFSGGWQAGILVRQVFESRPDSALSFGANQAWFGSKARANAVDAGAPLRRSESALELTYADTFGPVTLQPDLQYVFNPAGDGAIGHAVIAALRVSVGF
jgi:porin